jgi:hypothetical protein
MTTQKTTLMDKALLAIEKMDENVIYLAPKPKAEIQRTIIWPTGQQAIEYVEKIEKMELILKQLLVWDKRWPTSFLKMDFKKIHQAEMELDDLIQCTKETLE